MDLAITAITTCLCNNYSYNVRTRDKYKFPTKCVTESWKQKGKGKQNKSTIIRITAVISADVTASCDNNNSVSLEVLYSWKWRVVISDLHSAVIHSTADMSSWNEDEDITGICTTK